MANTTISPNMGMPVPVVSVDPGPDWATNIDSCLSIIDSHNHNSGQGVQITPDGIDINADLPFNDNNMITARSVRFQTQSAPIAAAADLGCIYESGVDLYYNDGVGNQIRLTQSGSPVGSPGTITGLPSGTASASFAGATFTFRSATNTPATMNIGPIITGAAALSPHTVTISASASLAADYALVWPLALPASTSYLNIDSAGNMATNTTTGSGTVVLNTAPTFAGTVTFGGNVLGAASFGFYGASTSKPLLAPAGVRTNATTFTINSGTANYDITGIVLNDRASWIYTILVIAGSTNNAVGTFLVSTGLNAVGDGAVGTLVASNSGNIAINSVSVVGNGSDTIIRANIKCNQTITGRADVVRLGSSVSN